jgi:hypothetical protein
MPDPLDALRLPSQSVEPPSAFADALLDRVRREVAVQPVVLAMSGAPGAPVIDRHDGVLDDALELLAGTAPEFDPFNVGVCISNHAPMTAEALCALGRGDVVIPWVERYGKYLTATPPGIEPIAPAEWRSALGDYARISDWIVFFSDELADADWIDVVNRWMPRLAPGGALGIHGVVRVAHAMRGLGWNDTATRRHELAVALAYLAAVYETLPERPGAGGRLRPSEALARIEQLPLQDRTGWRLFTQPLEKLRGLPSFATVTDMVDFEGGPSEFLTDLTEAVAGLLVTNAAVVGPRALAHALTAGAATRMMLPYLSDEATVVSLRYGWQIAASFYAGLVLEPAATDVAPPVESIDELIDEAVACLDEHGIKTLEACLREYAINPEPVYLAAARETTRCLETMGLHLR